MKNSFAVLKWLGVALFAALAVVAFILKSYVGVGLFLLGAILTLLISPAQKKKSRAKSKAKNSTPPPIILAIMCLVAGLTVILLPYIENTADNGSSIGETVSTDTENSSGNNTSNVVTDGTLSLSDIPDYSGDAYIVINNNVPTFSKDELTTKGYEKYADLDSLGRAGVALASLGKDTMPKEDEERGEINSVSPTGWVQAKYDNVHGGWLYNRCHLIGWQLSAENANKKNLITGTKQINNYAMLPFENMVADYIKETGNHVAYRISPLYDGDNLLASGVQMEAYSVEDNGEGIQFNIYCYNVQPGIVIDYATGESRLATDDETATSSKNETSNSTNEKTVYKTATGKYYHSKEDCSGLAKATKIYDVSLSEAKEDGLEPCSKCH